MLTPKLWVGRWIWQRQKVISAAALAGRRKSMPHSGLLISTKLIRLPSLWQLIRQLVNLVNDSVFPEAANTLFRKHISDLVHILSPLFLSCSLSLSPSFSLVGV